MFRTLLVALLFAAALNAQSNSDPRSVALFGAHPDDGATDATPGIQAAIDTFKRGRVYLPGDIAGTGAKASAVLSQGGLLRVEVSAGGSHYCKAPQVVFIGGGGQGAKAIASVDRNCSVRGVAVTDRGTGYTQPPEIRLVPQLRCYRVSQIHLYNFTMLEGDGEATCLIPDGSNQPVIFSQGAYKFRLRNLALYGDGKTDVGMQFNGDDTAPQLDGAPGIEAALLCTLDAVSVSGFREKNIELNKTYGFLFLNVHSHTSGGWGLYLRDGFNNATQIVGGEYSQNGIGGVYIGNDSIQLYFSSISEGNKKYAIYYHGHITGLQITDAYFEGNGRNHTGWDIYGDFLDYDQPAIGVSIRNSLFNSLDAEYAVHIENTVDLDFSHNIGMPPLAGDPFTQNALVLGRGVVNPTVEGNTRIDVRGTSGHPVHTGPAEFAENVLLRSGALNDRAWTLFNTGKGCPGHTSACQDGTRFHQNGLAWKVPLANGSGAANMTTVTQKLSESTAGRLLGGGVWMRTNAGTATAWLEVFDDRAVYTGTTLNQPLRQTIDTNWRWISTNVTTDAAGTNAGLRFRIYANDSSEATAVYLYAPQGWVDAAGTPQYAQTLGAAVTRRMSSVSQGMPVLHSEPNCKGHPDGMAGYDAAADKIWVCNNGIAKAH